MHLKIIPIVERSVGPLGAMVESTEYGLFDTERPAQVRALPHRLVGRFFDADEAMTFAAAPALLEACKSALVVLEDEWHLCWNKRSRETEGGRTFFRRLEQLRAAIALAGGGT